MTGVARKKPQVRLTDYVVVDVDTGKRRTRTRPGVDEGHQKVKRSILRSSVFGTLIRENTVRAWNGGIYSHWKGGSELLTTLAFWLRSNVVSVLNSLTAIMKASPSLLVI